MRKLRIALAQTNPTVGDLEGNTQMIISCIEQARDLGVDLVVFPELAITGYPPEDLLFKIDFVKENIRCLSDIVPHTGSITAVVGYVHMEDDIYNTGAVIHRGELVRVCHKSYLPNYGVFDENRYFQAGRDLSVFTLNDVTFGVNICEDIWYPGGPTHYQALLGNAELIVNISASPYHAGKRSARAQMLATRARDDVVVVAFTNMVGGQDELIFDGSSLVIDQEGEILAEGAPFAEDMIVADVDADVVTAARLRDPRRRQDKVADSQHGDLVEEVDLGFHEHTKRRPPLPRRQVPHYDGTEEVYHALVLGTRDYVRKNRFNKVVVGLSGGVDSAMVAVIAVEALGRENVVTVYMPSRYSSKESERDAAEVSRRLGTELLTIPIEDIFSAYLATMAPAFQGAEPNVAEENFQARIRGNILMGLSNKFGWLVLTTGNKSETSVGYATLYGDMAGGYCVLKDVPKMMVYELARYVNAAASREIIPQNVLTKVPTAELRPNQKDEDSLPPYPVLDRVLQAYVEEDNTYEEILSRGLDAETVDRVIAMVDANEYKRRQAPPGIKISPKAFGKDRRMPITNRFRSFHVKK